MGPVREGLRDKTLKDWRLSSFIASATSYCSFFALSRAAPPFGRAGWGNSRAKGVLVSIREGSVKKKKKKLKLPIFLLFFF